jgi:hypothetical protein
MNRRLLTVPFLAIMLMASSTVLVRALAPAVAEPPAADDNAALVKRGAYLVQTMACHDCHTPWKMGPRGPEPDMSRALTGHPEDLVMPTPPALPAGPWITLMAATNTAFAGPWGVSYTANLTPDPETGLGKWTYEMFIATMKADRSCLPCRHKSSPPPRTATRARSLRTCSRSLRCATACPRLVTLLSLECGSARLGAAGIGRVGHRRGRVVRRAPVPGDVGGRG